MKTLFWTPANRRRTPLMQLNKRQMKTRHCLAYSMLMFTLVLGGCASAPSNQARPTPKPIEGENVKLNEAGIQFTVPPGLKHRREGADTVVTTDDGAVEARFIVLENDFDAARAAATKKIEEYLSDLNIEQSDQGETVNELEAATYSGGGTAKATGKSVIWEMTLYRTDKKPVLLIIYSEKMAMEKQGPLVRSFFDSVRKL